MATLGDLYLIQEQQAANTSGQTTLGAGAWAKLVLNTELVTNIAGASLASSVITLPAGTYEARAHTAWILGSSTQREFKTRLRDTTNSANLIIGQSARSDDSDGNISFCNGRFTLAGSTNIEFQAWTEVAVGSLGGVAINNGETEAYTTIGIMKVS